MIFVIFTQHITSPIEISETGSVKGFALSLEKAEDILKEVLINENKQDQCYVHGVIIKYQEGALTEAMWTINDNQYIVSRYQCKDGVCIKNDKVPVDDFNLRVKGKYCIIM